MPAKQCEKVTESRWRASSCAAAGRRTQLGRGTLWLSLPSLPPSLFPGCPAKDVHVRSTSRLLQPVPPRLPPPCWRRCSDAPLGSSWNLTTLLDWCESFACTTSLILSNLPPLPPPLCVPASLSPSLPPTSPSASLSLSPYLPAKAVVTARLSHTIPPRWKLNEGGLAPLTEACFEGCNWGGGGGGGGWGRLALPDPFPWALDLRCRGEHTAITHPCRSADNRTNLAT